MEAVEKLVEAANTLLSTSNRMKTVQPDEAGDNPHHEEVDEGRGSCASESPEPILEYCRLIATSSSVAQSRQLRHQFPDHDVLTVLGGKASCRRKFVLSLQLLDSHGNLLPRDLPIVASVAFAHDHSPVRPPDAGEPPLFTTFNGVEFPAHDNPTRMVAGRATFKLAISLLSSKFENRLFCICFTPQTQPPLCAPCFSTPIRSISRKRTAIAQLTNSADGSNPPYVLHGLKTAINPRPQHHKHSPDHSSSDNNVGSGALPQQPKIMSCSHGSQLGGYKSRLPDSKVQQKQLNFDSVDPDCLIAHEDGTVSGDDQRNVDYLPPLCQRRNGSAGHHLTMMQMLSPKSTASPVITPRLTPSPVESGSPNSATLTSESCIDHHHHHPQHNRIYNCCSGHNGIQSCTLASSGRPLSAPSPPVSCTRPLRPQASVGVCKFPFASISPSISSSSLLHPLQGATSSRCRDAGPVLLQEADFHHAGFLLGAMQQLSSTAALASPVRQRLDTIMRSFMSSRRNDTSAAATGRSWPKDQPEAAEDQAAGNDDSQLEEEERAIRYLELSLYEVTREIQKRKEEVRLKRRRLMEDEARLHNIIFQSSSWINSLASKFSH